MYAGDNDMAKGKSSERVFADFAEFVAILQKNLPETTLHYVAIKPSLKRREMVDEMRRTNQLISGYCDMHDRLYFVDVDAPMLDENGVLIPELFVKDGLHLSQTGYKLWSATLVKSLKRERSVRSKEPIPSQEAKN